LNELGSEKVWVVHGDGFDEITVTGTTQVAALEGGKVRTFEIEPASVGLKKHPAEAIAGGDAVQNAMALREVLEGKPSAYRDMVLMNAGAALVIADKARDLKDGVSQAAAAIDNGAALNVLDRLVAVSRQGLKPPNG
jgi:anthranilate phosphoribosyltransferase